MNDRVHLPQVAVDSMLPGWSFWTLDGAPDAVVVRGHHCQSLGMLTLHSIEPSGEVNASINCCEPDHAFYILDGWPSNLSKRRDAVGVEPA